MFRSDKGVRGVRVGIVCETANRKGAGHMKEGSVLFIYNSVFVDHAGENLVG